MDNEAQEKENRIKTQVENLRDDILHLCDSKKNWRKHWNEDGNQNL